MGRAPRSLCTNTHARAPRPTTRRTTHYIPSHFTSDYNCARACVCVLYRLPETCTAACTPSSPPTPLPTTNSRPSTIAFSPALASIPSTMHSTMVVVALAGGGVHTPLPPARGALLSHNGRGGGHSIWLPYCWSPVARPFRNSKIIFF